ncbi:hypothetical protein SBA5_640019 [Candidatus Sulfotelmatomonas gaucii]|uniref:Uncharacterized protein n=1 Tax=Candidatus Sulfuritelmatomonas gaucii TaxID=2043161 RepID=A0A2N9LYC5_9BACT|nr:hypothetical protein SBA5_640019 [Candidatus Sulfotelmatomonas gaucii]
MRKHFQVVSSLIYSVGGIHRQRNAEMTRSSLGEADGEGCEKCTKPTNPRIRGRRLPQAKRPEKSTARFCFTPFTCISR